MATRLGILELGMTASKAREPMVEANPTINPVTGRQWDLNSLIEKLLELQDALLEAQERTITLAAQVRDLERLARDADDLRSELANQAALLADRGRENKYLHQELSRMAGVVEAKAQDGEELKSVIADLQHQLKTCQSERDLLAAMLTEAENAARRTRRAEIDPEAQPYPPPARESQASSGWLARLKGKQH